MICKVRKIQGSHNGLLYARNAQESVGKRFRATGFVAHSSDGNKNNETAERDMKFVSCPQLMPMKG